MQPDVFIEHALSLAVHSPPSITTTSTKHFYSAQTNVTTFKHTLVHFFYPLNLPSCHCFHTGLYGASVKRGGSQQHRNLQFIVVASQMDCSWMWNWCSQRCSQPRGFILTRCRWKHVLPHPSVSQTAHHCGNITAYSVFSMIYKLIYRRHWMICFMLTVVHRLQDIFNFTSKMIKCKDKLHINHLLYHPKWNVLGSHYSVRMFGVKETVGSKYVCDCKWHYEVSRSVCVCVLVCMCVHVSDCVSV